MATFYLSVTASSATASADISAGSSNTFIIDNPLPGGSYFTFETVRNSNGFYDSSSPKNMQGTYTINNGIETLVQSNYISAVAVNAKSTGSFTFIPTNNIVASTLRFLGTAAGEAGTISGGDTGSSFTGILDTYTEAIAGWSLRKLKSTATVSIRVRRSSDNSEQDIGFVGEGLDTGSLATFCAGTDGYVVRMYDQAGGNPYYLDQSTTSAQPKIYETSTGGVITKNGEPAIYYDGADLMQSTSLGSKFNANQNPSASLSIFTVFSRAVVGTYANIWEIDSTTSALAYWADAMTSSDANRLETVKRNGGSVTTIKSTNSTVANTQYLQSYLNVDRNTVKIWMNGTSWVDGTANSLAWSALDTFTVFAKNRAGSKGDYLNGWFKEMIVFDTDQTSNRTGIETNINNYY